MKGKYFLGTTADLYTSMKSIDVSLVEVNNFYVGGDYRLIINKPSEKTDAKWYLIAALWQSNLKDNQNLYWRCTEMNDHTWALTKGQSRVAELIMFGTYTECMNAVIKKLKTSDDWEID